MTGRPIHTLRHAAKVARVSGLAICSNGAILYDLGGDEIVRHETLSAEAARRFVVTLREALPGVLFAFVRGAEFACEADYLIIAEPEHHASGFLVSPTLGDALVLCEHEPTKLIARHPDLSADELLALVRALSLDGLEVTHSGAPFVEVAAPGITKARALAGLCADVGIDPGEVVAFGDAPNDLPMLRWAGHGVAVANAHPSVCAEADEIAPSNDDDGVAIVLERLLSCRG